MAGDSDLKTFVGRLAGGERLDEAAARDAFGVIMDGRATPSQIGAFLMALRLRGETVDEIAGAVGVMRERMTRVAAPEGAIDIVGTGGDGSGTYNVSTCAAFVLAGASVPVAKHGNRALSSRSGAADVLGALGVKSDLGVRGVERCLQEAGIGFMFAPNHHAAMRHVGPTRVEMGTRTIFNLLGPLANPAGVERLVVGVFGPEWCEPLAEALARGGATRAWVVHGDGLDEITTVGETKVASLDGGEITTFTIRPEDAGVERSTLAELKGGDAERNSAALRGVLNGDRNAYRDIVLMNAGAGLVVAGKADDLRAGVRKAAEALDSGAAAAALEQLVAVSNAKAGS